MYSAQELDVSLPKRGFSSEESVAYRKAMAEIYEGVVKLLKTKEDVFGDVDTRLVFKKNPELPIVRDEKMEMWRECRNFGDISWGYITTYDKRLFGALTTDTDTILAIPECFFMERHWNERDNPSQKGDIGVLLNYNYGGGNLLDIIGSAMDKHMGDMYSGAAGYALIGVPREVMKRHRQLS